MSIVKVSHLIVSIPLAVMLGGIAIDRSSAQAPLPNAEGVNVEVTNTEASQSLTRLKSGDRIRLTVVGFPDISGEQVIMSDGSLQIPFVGNLRVAGLTSGQAVDRISAALLPYIRRPQVALSVLNLRPLRISVTGEVLNPGPRLLTPPELRQNSNNPTNLTSVTGENLQTVSYALVVAGGITPNADLRNIIIRRSDPMVIAGVKTGTPKTEVKVDLWNVIQTGDLTADLQLTDGDEIFVPTAVVSNAEQKQSLTSTVAPSRITVQVAGEVPRPGPIQIAPTANVSAAVAAAGGPTDKAQARSIKLLRVSPSGNLERREFAFGQDSGPLRDGDVILVEKTAANRTLDTIGRILSPLSSLFFLLR